MNIFRLLGMCDLLGAPLLFPVALQNKLTMYPPKLLADLSHLFSIFILLHKMRASNV
jgi:hypothetical protein